MHSTQFYLVGEDPSTSTSIPIDPTWSMENLKKAIGGHFHVAQPTGITFHSDEEEWTGVGDLMSSDSPIGIRVDGQTVRDAPGPHGFPVVGNFYEIYPDHLGNHYRLFRKYGPIIKTTNLGITTYLTDSPDVAQVCLMESNYFTKKIIPIHPLWGIKDETALFLGDTETENWRIAHKFMPPAMGPKAVKHYTPLMQDCARSSFKVFDELDSRGESWNVYSYMVKLASQTIGKLAFGIDFGHFSSPEAPIHDLVNTIVSLLGLSKKVSNRGQWYQYLPFGDAARLREVQKKIYHQLQDFIDAAPESNIGNVSLNEAAVKATCLADYFKHAVDEKGDHFPPALAISNMMVMAAAGYTTTASLLSWMIYCITTYPGVQERLLQELVDYSIGPDTEWTPELAHSLPYMDKFVKETQRLHNASFQPARTTKTDVILPGGYRLPPDSIITTALYALHTNPTIWRDPLQFDPDRWDTEEVKNRHRCAYIPFATGPRGCIGFNFALLEVKILMAELVYRYEFVRDGVDSIDYDPEFQLIRPLNLFAMARKRTEWPSKSSGTK